MARNFKDLSEQEILALAISLEEEDGRIYGDFVDGLRDAYPASAKMFEQMQAQEAGHRNSLIEIHRLRFGDHYMRHRYMDTPFLSAAFQVVVGGVLVFLTGILIGSS